MLQGRKRQSGACLATVLAVSVGLVATPAAWAQDDQESIKHRHRAGETHEHLPQPNAGNISFSAGLDITNAYFFRGIIQEDQGFIAQSWLDATFKLSDTVDLTAGIWNSMHDMKTGAVRTDGTGVDWWYEADLYLGLSFAVADECSLGLTYTAYTSPNDAFTTIHELAISGSHDDADDWDDTFLEGSGLQPSVTIAFELDGQADGASNEGIYLELAIEPSFTLIDSQDQPVTLAIPVTIGLSLGDYYEDPLSPGGADDSNFGYLDIGAVLSTPLNVIPSDYGTWEASLGLHYLFLSESTENINANGDDSEFILSLGISMGY